MRATSWGWHLPLGLSAQGLPFTYHSRAWLKPLQVPGRMELGVAHVSEIPSR